MERFRTTLGSHSLWLSLLPLGVPLAACADDPNERGVEAAADEEARFRRGAPRPRPAPTATPTSDPTPVPPPTSDPPSGTVFQAIAPCLSEADYVRTSVVRVTGGTCSPRCVRLASGGTVVFLGSLSGQPVSPRALGTTASPIVVTATGGMAEFEFPDQGFFAFSCGPGADATGVVWSTFW